VDVVLLREGYDDMFEEVVDFCFVEDECGSCEFFEHSDEIFLSCFEV